ncbi:TetR/AcrR family transcriptional regulator [Isoptericola sp. 4D.3]|uniref:TetR/AcrR family transcriptional regulator n=1 Tax=Isoptericola peretonis TaxID=2918523 RepID=A0ABT0J4S8_9MICO|nr:TetR/AcrR family transcriptional regulator [Isoptericola sp. 4D.3]
MNSSEAGSDRRNYSSPLRNERARLTRGRVVEAAHALFVERGYAATSVAVVARSADVSTQTVYNAFGSKVGLLRAVYTARLVGQSEPTPPEDRQEIRALHAETDPVHIVSAFAVLSRELAERLGPLLPVVAAAADDPDLAGDLATLGAERLWAAEQCARRLSDLGALRPGLGAQDAADRLWALTTVELWQSLTGVRGWTADRYDRWLTGALRDAVLG